MDELNGILKGADDDNTLSVHITRLREKLRAIGVCSLIETKRGMGYRV